MFKLGWSVITLLLFTTLKAQQIDWEKINSNTILNIIAVQNPDLSASPNILQIGNNNNAELSINAKTDITVRQLGEYNTLYFVNSFTDIENRTIISAQGNNNIIDVTGSNSISDGMQIHVKGDNKTIFVRNY